MDGRRAAPCALKHPLSASPAGGGAFVFYRYFSCSFVSARGLRLSGAGGDVGVGYAVLIFEWLTRVARGSNFF